MSRRIQATLRAAVLCMLAASLSGCDFIDWLVKAIEGIGDQPTVVVRVAGTSGFFLDAKDAKDGSSSSQGWICVVHDPGCGVVGNDGTDRFFASGLPPLAKITGVSFQAIAPGGLPATTGTATNVGSYGANLLPGPTDGSQPIRVNWSNTCNGSTSPYYAKPVFYAMSFIVSMKKGTDLGEQTFDPNATPAPPTCAPASFTTPPLGTTSGPSNFAGVVFVCNPGLVKTSLIIKATLTAPLNAGATGQTSMDESDPVTFAEVGLGIWKATFATAPKYKPGSWTINAVQVSGITGPMANIKAELPGPPGSPALDFTGGSCVIR
jgi:hypothetical protein